jgi:hypothetical protein
MTDEFMKINEEIKLEIKFMASPFPVDLNQVSSAEAEKLITEWLIKSDKIDRLFADAERMMELEREGLN